MDTQKIGKFLKELRKEHNMTQEQLGDKIGVTNKTISRWETGNYMPPVENLKQLSDIYQVSINEILAGERIVSERYTEVADENVSNVLAEIEIKNKKFENRLILIMIINMLLAIFIMNLLPNEPKSIVIVIMVCAIAVISNILNLIALSLKKNIFSKNNV